MQMDKGVYRVRKYKQMVLFSLYITCMALNSYNVFNRKASVQVEQIKNPFWFNSNWQKKCKMAAFKSAVYIISNYELNQQAYTKECL